MAVDVVRFGRYDDVVGVVVVVDEGVLGELFAVFSAVFVASLSIL